jgi:hypothetical protein
MQYNTTILAVTRKNNGTRHAHDIKQNQSCHEELEASHRHTAIIINIEIITNLALQAEQAATPVLALLVESADGKVRRQLLGQDKQYNTSQTTKHKRNTFRGSWS